MSNPKRIPFSQKLAIFFFGIFIVGFKGFQYFDMPGVDAKERGQALTLYYLGIGFWVLVFVWLTQG